MEAFVSWSVVSIMVGLYGILSLYALLGGWTKPRRESVALMWFLILPAVLFVGLWFWGQCVWGYFYLEYAFIDSNRFTEVTRRAATMAALATSALVFIRLATGFARRRYRICLLAGSIVSVAIYTGCSAYDFFHEIDGWSARGAAENYFARRRENPFIAPNQPLRIIEEDLPDGFGASKTERRFALHQGNARVWVIHVTPRGWFWWNTSFSHPHPTQLDFDTFKGIAEWDTDEANVRLKAIIRDFPNSEASRRAEAILEQLQSRPKQE